MARRIYAYIIRYDDGTAPNPFWGTCTLTICKPAIRRTAGIGDWIVGTGSKNARVTTNNTSDLSDCLVYAMKVTGKISLQDYDTLCKQTLHNKIPDLNAKDWRLRMGDSVYDFSGDGGQALRRTLHDYTSKIKEISGKFALLSTHFYYFGLAAVQIPFHLKQLIKQGQGHKVIQQQEFIDKFEDWIMRFALNTIVAAPQMRWLAGG